MPPRVIRLIVMPNLRRPSMTRATASGMEATAVSVSRHWRRKTSSTSAARPTPIRMASRTPCTESVMKPAWS